MSAATATRVETTRLLAGLPADGSAVTLAAHRGNYRQPPAPGTGLWPDLVEAVEAAGLTGRGGAGFPTARKLAAVAARPGPRTVVVNGAEGEPASAKDRILLTQAPHLVIDGALLAAAAVGAAEVVIAVDRAQTASLAAVQAAVAARHDPGFAVRVVAPPSRYVSGESSALVQWLGGGPALPTGRHAHDAGILVQNVETLAHLAQILNFGPAWFRDAGTPQEPGTTLVTVSGAVARPSVVEVPLGTPLGDVVALAGGVSQRPRALLVGGNFGTWVPAAGHVFDAPFSRAGLAPLGASPGAGVVKVLPHGAAGLAETARILDWFAAESAGQCGPCVFGLPALAAGLGHVARGTAEAAASVARLRRWADEIEGRGACRHPDGAIRLLRSALAVFADELEPDPWQATPAR